MEKKDHEDPLWLKIALAEIGVKEVLGAKNNPRIIEYHAKTSLKASSDEVPWCAAFVNWCLAEAGKNGTNSASARSFLRYGAPVLDDFKRGDILIFKRGKEPWMGHVAFYLGQTGDLFKVVGGNQSNMVKISYYKKSDLIGVRRPV
jgi:uncharacterized protein (TIGR02594 family)